MAGEGRIEFGIAEITNWNRADRDGEPVLDPLEIANPARSDDATTDRTDISGELVGPRCPVGPRSPIKPTDHTKQAPQRGSNVLQAAPSKQQTPHCSLRHPHRSDKRHERNECGIP